MLSQKYARILTCYILAYVNNEIKKNKKPINCWGRQNATPLKFDLKPSEAVFSAVFPNFDKCRPEVAGDVVSGVL